MRELIELFVTFFKIGAFTFGGGYAMLSMLQREIVRNHKWTTDEELLDYFAIAQCTPGAIAINTATFVGSKRKGVVGGIVATLGVLVPSLIIILIIAACIQHFLEYTIVQHVLAGIRVAVAVLIINSVINMGKKSIVDAVCIVIATISCVLSMLSVSPVPIVVAAVVAGLLLKRGGEKS